MPRWIWIVITAYALVLMSVSIVTVRELSLAEALMARDFSNVWIAGQAALAGDAHHLYDREAYARLSEAVIGFEWGNNYSYPPHSLFLVVPFGLLPHPVAFGLWNLLSVILFAIAARPLIPPQLPRWAAIFNPATLVCFVYGHYGLLIGALWLWAFRGSGVAAGLATLKPHMGLMIFVRALAERRMFLVAAATTLAAAVLSALMFGIAPWHAFFTDTLAYQSGLVDEASEAVRKSMVTPWVAFGPLAHLAFAIAAALLVARRLTVFTAATATFLILPYGYHYDMTVACLGFAVLLASGWSRLAWWERLVLLVAFFVPQLVRMGSFIAPPFLLAALWLQVRYDETPAIRFKGRSASQE